MGSLVLNDYVALYGLMFENLFLSPFIYRIVGAKTAVCPRIFDVVIMSVVVKGGVFEVRLCTHEELDGVV